MKFNVTWEKSDLDSIHDCIIEAHYDLGDKEVKYTDEEISSLANIIPDEIKGFIAYIGELETEAGEKIYLYFKNHIRKGQKLSVIQH